MTFDEAQVILNNVTLRVKLNVRQRKLTILPNEMIANITSKHVKKKAVKKYKLNNVFTYLSLAALIVRDDGPKWLPRAVNGICAERSFAARQM